MQDFLIILTSTFTLVLSIVLFRKAATTLNVTKINLISIIFYALLAFSYIGSILIGLGMDNHYLSNKILNDETRLIGWLSVQIVMISMPLIMNLLKRILKFNNDEYQSYLNKKVSDVTPSSENNVFHVVLVLSLISIISVIYVFYTIGVENNPILNLLMNEPAEKLARLRILAGKEFQGNVYVKNLLALNLVPFLSYIVFVYALTKKEKKWKILFLVLFIVSLIIKFYNLEKFPVIRYLLTYIIIMIYIGYKIKFKHILVSGIFTSITIVLMYVLIMGSSLNEIFSITSGPLNRIIISSCIPLFFHFDIFKFRRAKLAGASLPSFISEKILGLKNVRSSRVVMEIINPHGIEEGTAGVMNGLYAAEAYANFGWFGILVSIILVSTLLYLVFIFFVKYKKNPVTLALFAYLTDAFTAILHGGVVDFIYNPTIVFIILISLLIIVYSKRVYPWS